MSDTWNDIQALKLRQSSLRDKLQRRKKAREEIVQNLDAVNPVNDSRSNSPVTTLSILPGGSAEAGKESSISLIATSNIAPGTSSEIKSDPEAEKKLLACLCDVALNLPIDSRAITLAVNRSLGREVDHQVLENLLQKFDTQELITIEEGLAPDGQTCIIITSAEHTKLTAFSDELNGIIADKGAEGSRKRKNDGNHLEESKAKVVTSSCRDGNQKAGESIESLLSMPSIREKENKRMGEEILDLLSKPTAKERSLAEKFRSQGGAQVKEFCPHGTTDECVKVNNSSKPCSKLHFKKIIQKHTDDSLGDCSFLNTCFHMDTCKYVHYEVDYSATPIQSDKWNRPEIEKDSMSPICRDDKAVATLYPPQWLQCDLRYFDMSILGKFAVVMADPPWDIHMELPYGTMSDDEMRKLNIPALQEEGLIFLWVTGRAMELGRECLKLWGYERCDEIIWVKTNQLQRIIRTGRTGHWLNHGKEHCLVGMKGNAAHINRGLDCDVIVAEVRATSHKPDEIYGIIERLSPGSRKIELFGRPHNVQPNWITLGNQVDGVRLLDPELVQRFSGCYPDGNCMEPRPKT